MDNRHYQNLLMALKQEETGRAEWLEYKVKTRWIDLSSADFTRRAMRGYDLSEADLSLAIFRETVLSEADLADAVLSAADLRRADLHGANLDRARLDSANLQDANLADACLERTNLARARLNRAMLIGADLTGADLSEADLSGACLKYVRLTGALLKGANVADADLTGAILDEAAAGELVNFDRVKVDRRQYRELRWRPLDPARPEANDELSQGRLIRVDARRAAHAGRGREDGVGHSADGGGRRERQKGRKNPPPHTPPLRDAEPDLSTVEGCCQVLEVPVNATMDEIVKAFRAKAKVYHPDKVLHLSPRLQDLAAEEFRRLRKAYEALTRRTARPLVGINWPEGMPRYASPYDYSSAQYEVLARFNANNTNILYNLAWKYFEEGRYAEARAGFERVVGINPKDEDAAYNIIVVALYTELLLPGMGE